MKNFIFCAAAVIMTAAICFFGYSVPRSGEGMAVMLKAKISAAANAGKIKNTDYKIYEKKEISLSGEPRPLLYEDMTKITVDGKEYDFPIRVGDLPDEFEVVLTSIAEVINESAGMYSNITSIFYNDVKVADGLYFTENKGGELNDDTVIVTLLFLGTYRNKYMPQTVFAGIDTSNADVHEVNRFLGTTSQEYDYLDFYAQSGDSIILMALNGSGGFSRIHYIDKKLQPDFNLSRRINIYEYEDGYYPPEGYSIGNDAVNSAMQYTPLPENNDALKHALDNLYINDKKITLPCTVNALLNTLGEDTFCEIDSFSSFNEEFGVYMYMGNIKTENDELRVEFIFPPDGVIGEAQVIKIEGGNSIRIEGISIDENRAAQADDIYGINYDENFNRYLLTDYEYNNIILDPGKYSYMFNKTEILYWGENTELKQR